jgi:hypothetical protein
MSSEASTRHAACIVLLHPRDEFLVDSPKLLQLQRSQALNAELSRRTQEDD